MKLILLENIEITLDISFKKNKNTYFRFYPNNLIKVNASKRQSEADILNFISKNKASFLLKVRNANHRIELDPTKYYLFGLEYTKVVLPRTKNIQFSHENQTVYEPNQSIEELKKQYQRLEKQFILKEIEQLVMLYQNNPYLSLKDVRFKTRSMKTRYGSCNKPKRSININLKLVHYDKRFLEYVFAHEIAHLEVANHQREFYELLGNLYPKYKEVRKELKLINIR